MWGLLMKLNENRTKVKSKTSTHSVSVDRIVPQVPGCLPYSDEALSKEGDTGWVELMNYCPRLENGVCYTSMKHCQKKEKQDELNWWITVPGQQKGACYTSMMHCQKKEKQDELNWWITVAGQKKGACYTSMKHCQEKEKQDELNWWITVAGQKKGACYIHDALSRERGTGWVELMNYCRGAEKRCVLHPWCSVKRKINMVSYIEKWLSPDRKTGERYTHEALSTETHWRGDKLRTIFKMHILKRKLFHFDKNVSELCF